MARRGGCVEEETHRAKRQRTTEVEREFDALFRDVAHPEGFVDDSVQYFGDDDDTFDVPCDTLAAFLFLRAKFELRKIHESQNAVRPVVLKSQLYGIVTDKTVVDRELDALRHQNKLRVFKLAFGPDEYAVLSCSDYADEVRNGKDYFLSKQGDGNLAWVFDWFAESVVPQVDDVIVTWARLGTIRKDVEGAEGELDTVVSVLLNAGLLTRTTVEAKAFNFTSPSVGRVVANIVKGRKELSGMMRRKRYPEISEKVLRSKKCELKHSALGAEFHMIDLVGKGLVAKMETTRGVVYRLLKTEFK